jgi:hypothetical protein
MSRDVHVTVVNPHELVPGIRTIMEVATKCW